MLCYAMLCQGGGETASGGRLARYVAPGRRAAHGAHPPVQVKLQVTLLRSLQPKRQAGCRTDGYTDLVGLVGYVGYIHYEHYSHYERNFHYIRNLQTSQISVTIGPVGTRPARHAGWLGCNDLTSSCQSVHPSETSSPPKPCGIRSFGTVLAASWPTLEDRPRRGFEVWVCHTCTRRSGPHKRNMIA